MTLTMRQQEICDDIVDGLTNEQIAKKRFIEVSTIKSHMQRIFKEYNVSSRCELVVKMYKQRINEIVGG